ncbi:hypothetical protein AAVH_27799 [Aphelenchoides avenae]|nr:hypothetical protein AAVH_27799 [Aphelenchus avenae]
MMSSEPSTPVCPYPTLEPVSDLPSGDRKQSCPLPTAPVQDHHQVDESIVTADPTKDNVQPLQGAPKQAQIAYYIEQHQQQVR